jgi:hypothetical protein
MGCVKRFTGRPNQYRSSAPQVSVFPILCLQIPVMWVRFCYPCQCKLCHIGAAWQRTRTLLRIMLSNCRAAASGVRFYHRTGKLVTCSQFPFWISQSKFMDAHSEMNLVNNTRTTMKWIFRIYRTWFHRSLSHLRLTECRSWWEDVTTSVILGKVRMLGPFLTYSSWKTNP